MLNQFLFGLTVVVSGAIGTAKPIPFLETSRLDYLNNLPATNRVIFPSQFPTIEYDADSEVAVAAIVYRRGPTIPLRITLRNNSPEPSIGTFTFETAKYVVGGTEFILTPANESFGASIAPNGGTQTFSISLGDLPDTVRKGTLRFSYRVEVTQGSGLPSRTEEITLYLVDENPVTPMNPVWTEVLDWACGWAMGKAGEYDVSKAIAEGGWGGGLFLYDPARPPRYTDGFEFNQGGAIIVINYFSLKEFITYHHGNNIGCLDVSHLMDVCYASQGKPYKVLIMGRPPMPSGTSRPFLGFRTHLLRPAGNVGFFQYDFGYHQVNVRGGSGDVVFDSTAQQQFDILADASQDVVPAHWSISTSLSANSYWQFTKSQGSETQWYGLVWGLPTGSSPQRIQIATKKEDTDAVR